mgnify:CR=1 FL=1
MCFCTPTIRTPFCGNCNTAMFKRIMETTEENARLRAALEEIQQLTDQFSIEMAIKEALKGQQ